MKRFGIVAVVLALFLAMGAPALAAPADTDTIHYDANFYDDDENFCLGKADITADINAVLHTTANGNGSHFANTETGAFEATNDSGVLLASGQYTFTVSINLNNKKGVAKGVATLAIHGTYADGSPLALNLVDRFEDDFVEVNGVVKWNCHDGEGPQRLAYTELSAP